MVEGFRTEDKEKSAGVSYACGDRKPPPMNESQPAILKSASFGRGKPPAPAEVSFESIVFFIHALAAGPDSKFPPRRKHRLCQQGGRAVPAGGGSQKPRGWLVPGEYGLPISRAEYYISKNEDAVFLSGAFRYCCRFLQKCFAKKRKRKKILTNLLRCDKINVLFQSTLRKCVG